MSSSASIYLRTQVKRHTRTRQLWHVRIGRLPVQALSGGRTVAEAVEVLTVSSDEDEYEELHQEQQPSQTSAQGVMLLDLPDTC